jgi:uncharacterized protein DUF2066
MFRFAIFILLAASFAFPAAAAPAPADLFTVSEVKIDATADSAIVARDVAMGQGRTQAWTKLFRRLTASNTWSKQPQLDDNTLQHLIRSFEVSGERRSTTRYLAEVTFHFNPDAVRAQLRQSNVAFTETRSLPALVIPLSAGKPGFDPMSPWALAWKDPSLQQGVVPFLVPAADGPEAELLSRPDLSQLSWAALAPLVRRYNASAVVIAIANDDAKTVQMIEQSPAGRTASSFAYAQSTFTADADAVAEKASEAWKTRNVVDYALQARLVADVQFDSLEDWARIRADLDAVKSISAVDVVGLALHEAEIGVSYSGRPEQLRDALAQQNLQLSNMDGQFTLQLAAASAANSP